MERGCDPGLAGWVGGRRERDRNRNQRSEWRDDEERADGILRSRHGDRDDTDERYCTEPGQPERRRRRDDARDIGSQPEAIEQALDN